MTENTVQELQDKFEELKAELTKYRDNLIKKLSEISNSRELDQVYINELPENEFEM